MLFEVEFVTKTKGNFQTVYTAWIHALSVTECQLSAVEIAQGLNKDVHFFIQECTL